MMATDMVHYEDCLLSEFMLRIKARGIQIKVGIDHWETLNSITCSSSMSLPFTQLTFNFQRSPVIQPSHPFTRKKSSQWMNFSISLKINKAQKEEFIRTCTRNEWKEEGKKKGRGMIWADTAQREKGKRGFFGIKLHGETLPLKHNVDLHPLSDDKEWAGNRGIDWLVYANVFLISWSFPQNNRGKKWGSIKK